MGGAIVENHAGADHAKALPGAGQERAGKVQNCITPFVFTDPFRMVKLSIKLKFSYFYTFLFSFQLSLSISLTFASALHPRFFVLIFISMLA